MSDTASTGVGATSAFNIYRLKANPTWVRFAPRGNCAEAPPQSVASSISADRCSSTMITRSGCKTEQSLAGCTDTSSGRASTHRDCALSFSTTRSARGSSVLADAAANAALHYERQQQHGQKSSRQSTAIASASASSLDAWSAGEQRNALHTSSAAPSRGPLNTCHTSSVSTRPPRNVTLSSCDDVTHSPAPPRNSASASSSLLSYACSGASRPVDRASPAVLEAPVTSGCVPSWLSSSARTPCSSLYGGPAMEERAQTPLRRVSSPSPAPSTASRAATSHLRGSAAVVDVEGPLDALYVPLRRPPPSQCEATRQHFSIFEVAERGRVGPRVGGACLGATATRGSALVRADDIDSTAQGGASVRRGGAGGWSSYETSNGVYGKGC